MRIRPITIIAITAVANSFFVNPWWVGSLIGLLASSAVFFGLFVYEHNRGGV